jgi:hypothetical protein
MTITPEGRQRIAEAQRRKWERYYEENPTCKNGHAWAENARVSTSPARSNGKSGRTCRACEKAKASA